MFRFAVTVVTMLLVISVGSSKSQAQSTTELPTIGTAGAGTMSIDRERLFGDFYMREIRAQAPIVNDPVMNEYLTTLGNNLVRHAPNVRYPFEFFWVNDDSINAFAFLGGNVGMHTGLLRRTETESELAAVLAHEIAHVTQRHIARNMERMNQASPMTMAQLIGGLVLALANPQLGMAAMFGTVAGAQQRQINYTRQFELEADRFGMDTLARAGFDPQGAPDFFGRLAAQYRYSTNMPQFLITHPLPESRIADTRSRANLLGPRAVEPSLDFLLAKSRVEARFARNEPRGVLREMEAREQRARGNAHRDAARYGQALAHLAMDNPDLAEPIIDELFSSNPLNLFYIDTMNDTLIAQQRYDEAVELMSRAYQRQPNNQVTTLNLAYAANYAGSHDLAVTILKEFIRVRGHNVVAYQLLNEAEQGRGNAVGVHEAQAELAAMMGNFRVAIEQLHNAHSKLPEEQILARQRFQGRIEQMRQLESERNRVANL